MSPLATLGANAFGVIMVLAIGWGGMYALGKLIERYGQRHL